MPSDREQRRRAPGSFRAEENSRAARLAPFGFALFVLTFPAVVRADPATAEALFREGRRLLEEGNYDAACPKLAESHLQDPASGTLINLALCYEKQGKLASAWAQYQLAAALARKDGRPDRVEAAGKQLSRLEPAVPRVVVHAVVLAPGISASFGMVRIGAAAFGSAIPIDPGTYEVVVSAPSRSDYRTSVTVAEGEIRTVEIPDLAPAAAPPPASPRLPDARQKPQRRPSPFREWRRGVESSPRPAPIAGYVVAGAGAVSLGLGTFYGIRSLSAYSEAERLCPTHRTCSEESRRARDSAETHAWISNVALGVGLLAGGTGAWLILSHDSGKAVAAGVRSFGTGAGPELRGAF
jgi:hypothetical protein